MSTTPNPRSRGSPAAESTPVGDRDTTLTGVRTCLPPLIFPNILSPLNTCQLLTLVNQVRLPLHSRNPITPSRLATSTTPSGNRSVRRTPRNRGVGAPSTPYGLRAMQRRAANTPARDRRKSVKVQRETTFDILRNLGRGEFVPSDFPPSAIACS